MKDLEIVIFGLDRNFFRDKTILTWFDQLKKEAHTDVPEEQSAHVQDVILNLLYGLASLEVSEWQ